MELSCELTYSFNTKCPGAHGLRALCTTPACLGPLPSEAKFFASELNAVRLSEENAAVRLSEEKACSDTKAPLMPVEEGGPRHRFQVPYGREAARGQRLRRLWVGRPSHCYDLALVQGLLHPVGPEYLGPAPQVEPDGLHHAAAPIRSPPRHLCHAPKAVLDPSI